MGKRFYNPKSGKLMSEREFSAEHPWPHMAAIGSATPSSKMSVSGINRPAENVVSVYAAMVARCEAVTQVPLILSNEKEELIEDGDLYTLLSRPNSRMDSVLYLTVIEQYLSLFDCAFIAMVGEGRVPDELVPLHPRHMAPIYGTHTPTGVTIILGWNYTDPMTGAKMHYDFEDVISISGINPHAPWASLSPLTAAKRSLMAELATREQNLALFINGGTPDIVLETDQKWTPEQAAEFIEQWQDRYSGFSNAHRPAILYGGLKSKTLGLNPEELQSTESLRMNLKDVVMVMRVMPAMLGVMESETGLSQGSSTDEQMVSWWFRTGLRELGRIASAHQRFLVDRFAWKFTTVRVPSISERWAQTLFRGVAVREQSRKSKIKVLFNLNVIQELVKYRLKKVETFTALRMQGYLPDDLNDLLDIGLPPHPNNVGILPFSVQAVTDVTGGQVEAEEPAPKEETSEADRMRISAQDKLDRMTDMFRASPAKFKGVKTFWDNFRKPLEKQMAKKFSRFYLEQRKRVLARLEKSDRARAQIRAEDDLDSFINQLFPLEQEAEEVAKLMGPAIVQQMKACWDAAASEIGGEKLPFDIDQPELAKAIADRKINASLVNETTQDDLRKLIAANFEEGGSVGDLADAIASYYEEHVGETKARPMVAARTQTTGIINDARIARAEKVGGLLKGWLHGSPEEPRPGHVAAQAVYMAHPIPVDEDFVVNGFSCKGPGDSRLPASETANCTCMTVFVSK